VRPSDSVCRLKLPTITGPSGGPRLEMSSSPTASHRAIGPPFSPENSPSRHSQARHCNFSKFSTSIAAPTRQAESRLILVAVPSRTGDNSRASPIFGFWRETRSSASACVSHPARRPIVLGRRLKKVPTMFASVEIEQTCNAGFFPSASPVKLNVNDPFTGYVQPEQRSNDTTKKNRPELFSKLTSVCPVILWQKLHCQGKICFNILSISPLAGRARAPSDSSG